MTEHSKQSYRTRPGVQSEGEPSLQLQDSEPQLRQLVDAIPIMIWTSDATGSIDYFNKQWFDYTGLDFEQSQGWNWTSVLLAEDSDKYLPRFKEWTSAGEPFEIEWRLRRRDGVYRWNLLRAVPLRNDTGQVVRWFGITTDINDRKLTEERFKRVVEASPNAIVLVNKEGQITLINNQTEKLFGYQRDELLGKAVEVLVPERFRAQHPGYRAGFFQAPQTRAMGAGRDLYGLRKDGSEVPVEIGLNPVQTTEGMMVLAAIIDITERKRAEEALRKSEARNAAILESALDCIITIDHDGNIIEFNPAAEKTFGYARAAVIGKPMADIIKPPVPWQKDDAGLAPYLTAGERPILGKRIEMPAIRADGSEFPIELSITAIPGSSPPVFTGFVRDITERKQAEEERTTYAARERQRRAEAEAAQRRASFLAEASSTLASSLDYVTTLASVARLAVPHFADLCTVDILETDGSIRRVAIAHANPEKRAIEDQLERRYPPYANAPAGPGAVIRTGKTEWRPKIAESLLFEVAQDEEHLRLLRQRGLQSYIAIPMVVRERTLGAITLGVTDSARQYSRDDVELAEDLAHRAGLAIENARLYREAQQALFTAKKAIGSRDDLIAMVSHDLRNPLSAIKLSTKVLDKLLPEGDRAKSQVKITTHAVERMRRLIEDLLDLARIDARSLSINKQRSGVTEIVDQVTEMLVPAAQAKKIQLSSELAPSLPPIDVDPARIVQVLGNLVGNAIKFTRDGGSVVIGAERIKTDVCFRVTDTGPGLAEEHFEHLFDRYWQAKETAQAGVGLGLAISKGIVESHGGQIWVESKLGLGSTFYFTVPVAG